jgi:glycosyltransferase involved in cell wall biosynthesis
MKHCTLTVAILTLNEEQNLRYALESVFGWADEIIVLDSYSSDATVAVANTFGCYVAQNKFDNYARQRNYVLTQLPITSEWILFLDADEWLPRDLKQEIKALIDSKPEENGFYIKYRMMWASQWIKRGYYPTWILRLFRYGKGRCEDRTVNEHLIIEGKTGYLKSDFVHEDRKGIGAWIQKHIGYAEREALELCNRARSSNQLEIDARLFGSQAQRKRWLRYRIWNRMPPLLRPFLYFFCRYVLSGAFLEGRAAFLFHFMHALWFPMLIDAKYLEMKRQSPQ